MGFGLLDMEFKQTVAKQYQRAVLKGRFVAGKDKSCVGVRLVGYEPLVALAGNYRLGTSGDGDIAGVGVIAFEHKLFAFHLDVLKSLLFAASLHWLQECGQLGLKAVEIWVHGTTARLEVFKLGSRRDRLGLFDGRIDYSASLWSGGRSTDGSTALGTMIRTRTQWKATLRTAVTLGHLHRGRRGCSPHQWTGIQHGFFQVRFRSSWLRIVLDNGAIIAHFQRGVAFHTVCFSWLVRPTAIFTSHSDMV